MYYLENILSYFPNAKVINMVRGQRDVLLSQKDKWKKKFLGTLKIPLSEAEIYLSQFRSHKMISELLYHLEEFQLPPLLSIFYIITFPVKLGLAFFFNIKRMGNMVEVINKRFFK